MTPYLTVNGSVRHIRAAAVETSQSRVARKKQEKTTAMKANVNAMEPTRNHHGSMRTTPCLSMADKMDSHSRTNGYLRMAPCHSGKMLVSIAHAAVAIPNIHAYRQTRSMAPTSHFLGIIARSFFSEAP